MKYHVVTGFNLETLIVNMNMFLKNGWTPLGGVAVAPDVGRFIFCSRLLLSRTTPKYLSPVRHGS